MRFFKFLDYRNVLQGIGHLVDQHAAHADLLGVEGAGVETSEIEHSDRAAVGNNGQNQIAGDLSTQGLDAVLGIQGTNMDEVLFVEGLGMDARRVRQGNAQIGRNIRITDGTLHDEFPGGLIGIALNLDETSIGAVLMGDSSHVEEGDEVRSTGRVLSVPVGDALLGRVIDPIGNPIDGKGPINATETRLLETQAPSVVERQPVSEPLQTGIKAIDSMTPIGRGQRQLIIGDRQTGKTAIVVDTILNQKGLGVKCIYVAIGQKQSTVAQVVDKLTQFGAMEYTTIVAATASDPAPMQLAIINCTRKKLKLTWLDIKSSLELIFISPFPLIL